MKKRLNYLMLVFGLVLWIACGSSVSAAGLTLDQLKEKFKQDWYWNHVHYNYNNQTEADGGVHCNGNCPSANGGNQTDGCTRTPCRTHTYPVYGNSGYYDCNYFDGAVQCCGFAKKLFYDAYETRLYSRPRTSWENAKPGDVIHYKDPNTDQKYGHWAMIIEKNGDTVKLGEANYISNCRINWGRDLNRWSTSFWEIYSAPYELPRYTPAQQAPASVSLGKSEIGIGDALNVSWSASSGASSYIVNLVCTTNAAYNQTREVWGTNTSFSISQLGTYQVKVTAKNNAGSSSAKVSGNAVAHPNITVTYKDYDGSVIKAQSVRWGGNATPPGAPTREGYTFQNWSNAGKGLKTDTTITAQYQINSYVVTFVDYNGNVIDKSQKVEYGSTAVPPTEIPTKEGYIFTGWSSDDYKEVKSALTIEAVYVWENSDLPIITKIVAAKRNAESTGYNISISVTNFPDDFTKGKVVTALKTKDGKLVASETDSIGMPVSGEAQKDIFVMYSGLATQVEVSIIGVVDDDTTGTPKSKAVISAVDLGDEWSDWTGNPSPTGSNIISETRTEYRYKDMKVIRSTSKPSTPKGYTFISSSPTGTYTAWSSWSGWDLAPVYGNSLTNVATCTGYRYFAFPCSNCGQRDDLNGACSKCGQYTLNWQEKWGTVRGYDYSDGWSKFSNTRGTINWLGTYWYFELDGTPNGANGYGQYTAPLYRYQTRQEYYDYVYWQTDFGDWQPEEVTASSTREVETRTAYRFKTSSAEVPCYNYKRYKYQNLNTGKTVYTYTSVYADSMEYPGEWEYNKAFSQLEKIATVDENIDLYNGYGDLSWYRADVNDEGTTTVFEETSSLEDTVGTRRTIEGTIEGLADKCATLLVYKGKNSDPTASQIEYIGQTILDENGNYHFDYITKEEPTAETGDFMVTVGVESATNYMVVDVIEAPKPVYTVEFIDEDGTAIGEPVNVKSGDNVEAPVPPEKEGYEFAGWDTGLNNVRENLIVTAKYQKKKYTVVFVNWDNSSVAVKEFDYGAELKADVIPQKVGFTFTEWQDENGEVVTKVTEHMIVTAGYKDAEYIVTFLDWNGEVLSQSVAKYDEKVEAPKIAEPADPELRFKEWDSHGEEEHVTRDIVISPVSEYLVSAETPKIVTEDNDELSNTTVTITTDTQNADIYYCTIDAEEAYMAPKILGCTGVKYEEPIVLEENKIVCAYAVSDKMNNSDITMSEVTVPEKISVSEIKLNQNELTMEKGSMVQLEAEILPNDVTNAKVIWSTDNEKVVAVTQNGMVIALAEGTAKIKVAAQDGSGVSSTCTVTVVKANEDNTETEKPGDSQTIEISQITLNEQAIVLKKGENKILTATIVPQNATNQTLVWASSDNGIVTVEDGKVTAVDVGRAVVTVASMNGKIAQCTVTVEEDPRVRLNATKIPLQVGKSTTALKIVSKTPSNDKVAKWTSSNKKIVTVSKKGKIKAVKKGKAIVTVIMKSGAKAKCTVVVQKGKVTMKKLTLNEKKITLKKGKTVKLIVTRNPITATEKLTWSTSNKKIATVDKNGKVKAKKKGKATITVKSKNGKKVKCVVTVK